MRDEEQKLLIVCGAILLTVMVAMAVPIGRSSPLSVRSMLGGGQAIIRQDGQSIDVNAPQWEDLTNTHGMIKATFPEPIKYEAQNSVFLDPEELVFHGAFYSPANQHLFLVTNRFLESNMHQAHKSDRHLESKMHQAHKFERYLEPKMHRAYKFDLRFLPQMQLINLLTAFLKANQFQALADMGLRVQTQLRRNIWMPYPYGLHYKGKPVAHVELFPTGNVTITSRELPHKPVHTNLDDAEALGVLLSSAGYYNLRLSLENIAPHVKPSA